MNEIQNRSKPRRLHKMRQLPTLDSTHFESDSEGKSKVIGGMINGKSTGIFNDEKIIEAQAAADACPVSVITVTKME